MEKHPVQNKLIYFVCIFAAQNRIHIKKTAALQPLF